MVQSFSPAKKCTGFWFSLFGLVYKLEDVKQSKQTDFCLVSVEGASSMQLASVSPRIADVMFCFDVTRPENLPQSAAMLLTDVC